MFGALGTLLGRAANTVNNDVVAPIQRDVMQPVANGLNALTANVERPVIKTWQTINPNSGYNQLKPIVRQAQNQYQFTPSFSAIMNGSNPAYTKSFGANGNLQQGVQPIGEFLHKNPVNQIQMQKGITDPNVLVHEALHREWQVNPNDHSAFTNAYMQGADAPLRSYLAGRLQPYNDFNQGPNTQLMNISQATPEIQNEIHSFIPEYYATSHQAMPAPLASYYSQFFNPSAAFQAAKPYPTLPAPTLMPGISKLMQPMGNN